MKSNSTVKPSFTFSNKQAAALPSSVVDELSQTELLSLDLSKNVFTQFPENIFHWEVRTTSYFFASVWNVCFFVQLMEFLTMRHLNFIHFGFYVGYSSTNFPKLRLSFLFHQPCLTSLSMAFNRLSSCLSTDIGKFTRLQSLDLRNNQLDQLPGDKIN